MKIIYKIAGLFCAILLFSNLSCSYQNKKEKAKTNFDDAVKELSKLGGIASFEAPNNKNIFPKYEDISKSLVGRVSEA